MTRLATRHTLYASLTPFPLAPLWLAQSLHQAAAAAPFVFRPHRFACKQSRLWGKKTKARNLLQAFGLNFVGVTRFELATPRPPDVYSNRAELHPELFESGYWGFIHRFRTANIRIFLFLQTN